MGQNVDLLMGLSGTIKRLFFSYIYIEGLTLLIGIISMDEFALSHEVPFIDYLTAWTV